MLIFCESTKSHPYNIVRQKSFWLITILITALNRRKKKTAVSDFFFETLWNQIKKLTRWTLCGEYTIAGLFQPALALPSPCFDESGLPASFHCHYATHNGPKRPAGSLAHRTSCSWNLQWPQCAEILVRQWKDRAQLQWWSAVIQKYLNILNNGHTNKMLVCSCN